jgi:hypothetical protein
MSLEIQVNRQKSVSDLQRVEIRMPKKKQIQVLSSFFEFIVSFHFSVKDRVMFLTGLHLITSLLQQTL